MSKIEEKYLDFLMKPSDVQKHLPILKKYVEKTIIPNVARLPRVVEMGFRGGISTAALMAGNPSHLTIIDWDKPPFNINRERLREIIVDGMEQNILVEFIAEDSLTVPLDGYGILDNGYDLLFIDTFHTYEHLFLELIRHSNSVGKYILIHDTDEPTCPGMFNAIEDFLTDNFHWSIIEHNKTRPGLTVLGRQEVGECFRYSNVFMYNLRHEVEKQQNIYYNNPFVWNDYILNETLRFRDAKRWSLTHDMTNNYKGATELMIEENTSPQTDH